MTDERINELLYTTRTAEHPYDSLKQRTQNMIMAETIDALHQSGHDCRIMVGGAVLTPEYAAQIGADYYAKDAKQSADIARQVLG